jgi:hypothetical protein
MGHREELLATLGLGANASWDEVTQAYKDMMRVWHPDRFPGDERLRKKAEEQAQRINHAMGELRKIGKAGLEQSKNQPTASSSPGPSPAPAHTSPRPPPRQYPNSAFRFAVSPLHVRPKVNSAIFKIAAACMTIYLAYDSLLRPSGNPQQEAFMVALVFTGLDLGIRNLLALGVPGSLVAVDKSGLFLFKAGRLGWTDFESVWPVMTPRYSSLSIKLSNHYIQKQSPLMRAGLRIKCWFQPAHVVIPFNGLTSNPIQVVEAMKLFQLHDQMVVENISPRHATSLLLLQVIAIAACTAPIIRCLQEGGLSQLEYTTYFVVFSACRVLDFVLRRMRAHF